MITANSKSDRNNGFKLLRTEIMMRNNSIKKNIVGSCFHWELHVVPRAWTLEGLMLEVLMPLWLLSRVYLLSPSLSNFRSCRSCSSAAKQYLVMWIYCKKSDSVFHRHRETFFNCFPSFGTRVAWLDSLRLWIACKVTEVKDSTHWMWP